MHWRLEKIKTFLKLTHGLMSQRVLPLCDWNWKHTMYLEIKLDRLQILFPASSFSLLLIQPFFVFVAHFKSMCSCSVTFVDWQWIFLRILLCCNFIEICVLCQPCHGRMCIEWKHKFLISNAAMMSLFDRISCFSFFLLDLLRLLYNNIYWY